MEHNVENDYSGIILKIFYGIILVIAIIFGILAYKDYNDFYIEKSEYKLSSDSSFKLVIYRKKGTKQDNEKYKFKINTRH